MPQNNNAARARIFVSGSFCYDVIFNCADDLRDAGAGVVFYAPQKTRAYGGCGGNIAYGLAQLGDAPLLMTEAGRDWQDYFAHLSAHGIGDAHIRAWDDCWTAQAFIINDKNGKQMTVFHPGASAKAHLRGPKDIEGESPALGIVSPNAGEAMMRHARELSEMKTPFIFDPGQALALLSGEDLRAALKMCACAIFNTDEFQAAMSKCGASEKELCELSGALLVTDGENGSRLQLSGGGGEQCAAALLGETKDTTGCGDAYRAGLLHGTLRGWHWQKRMQFASTIAGVKAQSNGGQEYQTTAAEVETLRAKVFG